MIVGTKVKPSTIQNIDFYTILKSLYFHEVIYFICIYSNIVRFHQSYDYSLVTKYRVYLNRDSMKEQFYNTCKFIEYIPAQCCQNIV